MIVYLIGLISGIAGGMGIGGGTILIPSFILFFSIDQHIIQGINLLYFIPTAIIAIIIHCKNKYINFKIAGSIIIFGLIGSVFGAYIAVSLPSNILKRLFGLFLFFMGLYELAKSPSNKIKKTIS